MNQEIIKREVGRTPDDRMVLHFFQEGSFYRAYEWSAWLAHRFIKNFKVTHKKMKDVENPVAYIGFPVTSIEKYTPENATIEIVSEKELDMFLSEDMIPNDMNMEIMSADFQSWKESIPLTEFNKKMQKDDDSGMQAYSAPAHRTDNLSITSIMQKILAFPIENKTPMQCMSFLADTKMQLASLI